MQFLVTTVAKGPLEKGGNRSKTNIPHLLHNANITLTPKPGKDSTEKLQTNVTYEHRCKNVKGLLVK